MHATLKLARAGAAATAAAAATVASQPAAQARAPVQAAPVPQQQHAPKFATDSDWLLAEVQDERVLFTRYEDDEVDAAVMHVSALFRPPTAPPPLPRVTITEVSDTEPDSSNSSDHASDADRVIEATTLAAMASGGPSGAATPAGQQDDGQLRDLLTITSRMLKRPGLQREVVKCMLEDEEVRELMMRQSRDLDRYLLSAGIATPYLLPEGTSGAAAGPDGASNGGGGGGNLMANLVGVIAGWMEKLDGAVSFLGGWLRDRWSDLTQGGAQRMEQQEGEGAAPNARPRPTTDRVLGGVMVLAIAVFCVMVVRRPLVLRRMR